MKSNVSNYYQELVARVIAGGTTASLESFYTVASQLKHVDANGEYNQESFSRFEKPAADAFKGEQAFANRAQLTAGLDILKKIKINTVGKTEFSAESFRNLTAPSNNGSNQLGVPTENRILGSYGSRISDIAEKEVVLEGFEKGVSNDYLAAQTRFNIEASTQDAFGELFYRTTIVESGVFGKTYKVSVPSVYTDYTHTSHVPLSSLYSKLRNLTDAVYDGNVLDNSSTSLVPIYDAGNTGHDALFVQQIVLPDFKVSDQVSVVTRPLTTGKYVDLLALSANPALVAEGVYTSTDRISDTVRLETLYWQIGATTAYVGLDVSRAPASFFHPSRDGSQSDLSLDFIGTIRITNQTKNTAGGNITEFNALANGIEIIYDISATGRINVETGVLPNGVNHLPLVGKFRSARNGTTVLASNDGTIAAAKTVIESFVANGYTLKTARTNTNLRTTGLIVHSRDVNYNSLLQWKAPISSFSTIVAARKNDGANGFSNLAADLAAPARIRNSNDAVKELFKHSESLKQQFGIDGTFFTSRDPEALTLPAGYFVMPYYKEINNIDLTLYTNSTKSHERNLDVQAALLNLFRKEAIEMLRGSRYDAALKVLVPDINEQPNVIIGTDQLISRYLQESGDVRTMGPNFSFDIASTSNTAMQYTVFMTFSRKAEVRGDNDILSFGEFLWSPELIGDYQVSVGGATINRAMVFPRYHHQTLLPILVKFTFDAVKFAEATQHQLSAPLTTP